MDSGLRTLDRTRDIDIIENHLHAVFNVTLPNGAYRYAALTFNSLAAGETVTIAVGATNYVYTMVNALGAPAANNVQVKVQGSIALSAQMLKNAVNGVTDATNIAYGAGTQPHPVVIAQCTGIRTAIGGIIHPTPGVADIGPTLRLRDKYPDIADLVYVLALTDTTAHAGIWLLTDFIRTHYFRYTFTGNAAALNNRIAGVKQCIIPLNAVTNGSGNLVAYDPSILIVEGISLASLLVECDLYYSLDEVTFVMMSQGQELSHTPVANGSQEYHTRVPRIPSGGGLYCAMRTNGQLVASYIECKTQIHIYPEGV